LAVKRPHNYRKPLHFSHEALKQAKGAIHRFEECIQQLNNLKGENPYSELNQLLYDIKTGFTKAMDDDLDIASAMAALFKTVRKINRLITNNALDRNGARRIRNLFQRINDVVSIFDFEEHPLDVTAQKLVRSERS